LIFGLLSGAISSGMMIATTPFADRIGFDKGEILGYTSLVLSFLLVFFGVRSYRDNVGGGKVTFGKAFQVGLLITLVSCVCYVVTWEILYFNFMPGFVDNYAAYMVEHAKASGATPESIRSQLEQMQHFKQMYDNPVYNAAITFIEPFPVGLLLTLLSATILRRKLGNRRTDGTSNSIPNEKKSDSTALDTAVRN
jgi:hypothetical protein